jgi:hypothetical protein
MGPTYLVLLVEGDGSSAKTTLVYRGDDEENARSLYDYARSRGLTGCTVYLTTVRAEARLS